MEKIPDIFRRGKVAYEKLAAKLYDIYKILPLKIKQEMFLDKTKKTNNGKDSLGYKKFRQDFNLLLQYTLLDIATSGNKVYYLEMLFIADIADAEEENSALRIDHTLASTIKKHDKNFKGLTYFMLPTETAERVFYFKNCILEYVEPVKVRLMKAFAIAQSLDENLKIEKHLIQDFAELLEAFMSVEGMMEREDPSIAANKLKESFFAHIDDYKNKTKRLLKP